MITFKIYTLTNPFTNDVFYVGKTVDLKNRIKGHLLPKHADNLEKRRVVSGILDKGGEPILEEIDTINCVYKEDEDTANDLEIYWIHQMKAWGFPVVNICGLSKPNIYKRRFESQLKQSPYELIDSFIDKEQTRLTRLRNDIRKANNLTEEEKTKLFSTIKETWISFLKDLDNRFDIGFTEETFSCIC